MDNSKRACLVGEEEDDEDGNLSSDLSEPSMGENDEEFKPESDEDEEDEVDEDYIEKGEEVEEINEEIDIEEYTKNEIVDGEEEKNEVVCKEGNKEQDTKENEDIKEVNHSKYDSAKSKISLEGEAVSLPEDSSSVQPENEDDTMSFNEDNRIEKTRRKATPTVKKNNKVTTFKTKRKVTRKVSKNTTTNILSDEDSSPPPSPGNGKSKTYSQSNRFVRQPTPLCDAILKDYAASKQNNENPPEKRQLRGSKNNNSKHIKSPGMVELNDQSDIEDDPNLVNEDDPNSDNENSPNSLDEIKSKLPIIDPLLVKKEESYIKLEMKEEITDEDKDDIKPFSIENQSSDFMDCDKSQDILGEDKSLTNNNQVSRAQNTQKKRKRIKRKIDDDDDDDYDPSYSPKTKKRPRHKKVSTNQQEKTVILSDESKDDLKPFSIEDTPLDLMDYDESHKMSGEDESLMDINEISPIQNKRKRMKKKNEDDGNPSYSLKTKEQSVNKNISKQQEKTVIPTDALLKIDETQSATRRRGKPPKCPVLPLSERNQESVSNNLFSDGQLTKNNQSVSATTVSELVKTQILKSFNITGLNLQPIVSLVPCDSLIPHLIAAEKKFKPSSSLKPTTSVISNDSKRMQPITPRKRGRPTKANYAESPQNIANITEERSVVNLLNTGPCQNSQVTKLEENDTDNLELKESNPDPLFNNLLKTEDFITPTTDQENVFDNNDLLCLQKLDTPVISSQTIQITASMTAKDTNSFIADYLNSHQQVFDDAFFQNILPLLSEILMLCMDEFTELLGRYKKAKNFTTEEFRQQELKLAIQSFCTMVSTYSEKFFPNFNSVMYKIDQNKTKKGLLIALVLFMANSMCVKAPKFKGQIHSMRKMLMCMCQIRKINSPLFCAVLTTPETDFNDELRLLVKILLVLQRKNVLAIPTTALPEASSIDSIEETCELIISSNTNCLVANDITCGHSEIGTEFVKILQDGKQHDFRRIRENLNHILCLFKQSNHDSNSETIVNNSFELGLRRSFTQQNKDRPLAESLRHDQVVGLDSLFESYLKSARNSNDDTVKAELDVDYQSVESPPSYVTQSSDLRLPAPNDNNDGVVKVEEIDCGSLVELSDNIVITESSTVSTSVNSFIPENSEQDPLSF